MSQVPASVHSADRRTTSPCVPSLKLRRQALLQFGLASGVVIVAAFCLQVLSGDWLPGSDGMGSSLAMIGLWSLIALFAWRGLAWHRHEDFGAANTITTLRATGTALLAGLVPVAGHLGHGDASQLFWPASLLALGLLLLDGVDGYLARLTGLVSAFGARFDMEIDSLLALVLSIVVWRSGEAGFWILALGVMRYLFVLTSAIAPPLRGELFPSFRRKLICVVQLASLCAILSPLVQPPLSQWVGMLAVLALAVSFAVDIRWLYRHRS